MTRSRERLVFLKTPKIVGWNFVEGSCSPFSHHRQAALAEMDLLLPFTTARKRERGKECLTFFRTQSGKWYVIQMCQEKEQKWEERRGEMRIHERESKLQSGVGWGEKEGRQNGECRAKDTMHFEDVKTLIYPVHHLSLQDFYEGRRPWRLIKICYIFIQPSNWQFLSTLGIKGKKINQFPWGIICIVL